MGKVGIVGYSLTTFRDDADMSSDELVFVAASAALKDAGVDRGELDAVSVASIDAYDGITISNGWTAPAGGGYGKDATRIQGGGVAAVMSAYASILSGAAELALVAGGDSVRFDDTVTSNASYDVFFNRPIPLFNVSSYALLATSLLRSGAATEDDFAMVAAKNYRDGAGNRWAHVRAGYSIGDVASSPMTCWPLRALEIAPCSKGACALVLASERKARELSDNPVWITGIAGGSTPCFGSWAETMEMKGLRRAITRSYRMAGIGNPAKDVDTFEIFSPAAPFELAYYEPLGLCGKGGALELLRGGITSGSGALPVNPSGGALCTNPGNCGGVYRVASALNYLRDHEGARRAVVQDSDINLGIMGETYHVMVVEKERA
jgi:acetyl-CoA C-acetyltransferase